MATYVHELTCLFYLIIQPVLLPIQTVLLFIFIHFIWSFVAVITAVATGGRRLIINFTVGHNKLLAQSTYTDNFSNEDGLMGCSVGMSKYTDRKRFCRFVQDQRFMTWQMCSQTFSHYVNTKCSQSMKQGHVYTVLSFIPVRVVVTATFSTSP